MGINALNIKQSNVHTVLWTLCSRKTSTIKDLAQLAGLSYATVGNILNGLVESGEVLQGEPVSATGGRPIKVYTFNAEYAHVLALSARLRGGQNVIHACVGNLYGEAVWQTEQSFESIDLTSFEAMLDACLRAYPTIRVLAFSLPGVERNGTVQINGYKDLVGVSLADHFQGKYHLPVIVENDVNAAVFGYSRHIGPAPAIVGVYFPRAFPGAGIVIDGKILKGADGSAGEVALMPLGIDWLAMDFDDPQQIGPAVARMLCILCSILNPNHVVLYGDFFTDVLQQAIWQAIQTQEVRSIFPILNYQSDFGADICAGLIAQATSAYRNGISGKSRRGEDPGR